jgi:hypothetical protein
MSKIDSVIIPPLIGASDAPPFGLPCSDGVRRGAVGRSSTSSAPRDFFNMLAAINQSPQTQWREVPIW